MTLRPRALLSGLAQRYILFITHLTSGSYNTYLPLGKQGDSKGCTCYPEYEEVLTTQHEDTQMIINDALAAIGEGDIGPVTSCPGDITNVPSEFFLDKTSKAFCDEVMGDLGSTHGPKAYDIQGNKIPLLTKRSPPENIDNYQDYQFFLEYEKQDGDCLVEKEDLCRSAYQELVRSNCKFCTADFCSTLFPCYCGVSCSRSLLTRHYHRRQ